MTRHGQLSYLNLAGMNPGRMHGAILRNPVVTFFRSCRLDVFRVGIEVCGLLTGQKAASIVGVGAAK